MTTTSKNSNRLKNLLGIVTRVKNALPCKFLQMELGRSHVRYLLIYVVGLILLDRYQTMAGISGQLLVCFHDSLYRMLATMRFSQRLLNGVLIFVISLKRTSPGWIMLDDTSLVKRFAKCIEKNGQFRGTKMADGACGGMTRKSYLKTVPNLDPNKLISYKFFVQFSGSIILPPCKLGTFTLEKTLY